MVAARLPSLKKVEAQVTSDTAGKHERELDLIERLLNTYLAGLTGLRSFSPPSELNDAWVRLVTRSFNSMRCAFDLIQRGYYSQAIVLVRSVKEDWLTCMDCRNNPDTLRALVNGGRMPKPKTMASRLDVHLREQWHCIYHEESQFAHASARAIRVLVDPKSHLLRLGGHYDRDLFIAACYSLVPAILRMMEFLAEVLRPNWQPLGNHVLQLFNEAPVVMGKAHAWMREAEAYAKEAGRVNIGTDDR